MILISHRGNVFGPVPEKENNPDYILEALSTGYDVEVDAWYTDGWYLGHDAPRYSVSDAFLETPNLWIHCKNYEALQMALDRGAHCFYHAVDDYTVTSRGYIWAFPGKPGGANTICVIPELINQSVIGFVGVCSDYIAKYDSADIV